MIYKEAGPAQNETFEEWIFFSDFRHSLTSRLYE